MKSKIRTKTLEFKFDAKTHASEYDGVIIQYDRQFLIRWESEDTFVSVTAIGNNAEEVADSIRRLLAHKYPLATPVSPR